MSVRESSRVQFGDLVALLRDFELRLRSIERGGNGGGSIRIGNYVLSVDGSGNLVATSTVAPFTVTVVATP